MNVTIETDPLSKYQGVDDYKLMNACGILTQWLVYGTDDSLQRRLLDEYAFYNGPMTGGTLSREGLYQYPEDPEMYALVKFESDTEICFVFDYGIVGIFFKETGDTWITRMD